MVANKLNVLHLHAVDAPRVLRKQRTPAMPPRRKRAAAPARRSARFAEQDAANEKAEEHANTSPQIADARVLMLSQRLSDDYEIPKQIAHKLSGESKQS